MQSDIVTTIALLSLLVGCRYWPISSDAPPGIDQWRMSKDGTLAHARSSWSGVLRYKQVYDRDGGQRQTVVLEQPAGLNPADPGWTSASAREQGAMPPEFYLEPDGALIAESPLIGSRVRVHGRIATTVRGYPLRTKDGVIDVYVKHAEGGGRTHSELTKSAIWPIVHIEKVEPIDPIR